MLICDKKVSSKQLFYSVAVANPHIPKLEAEATHIALRLMTWTNNFSKTFLIFASLIPFFRLIIPEKCFYQ